MSIPAPSVGIVADTTASLPKEFLQYHPIEVVPQVILFGEESLLEEVEVSYPDFVRRLTASAESPKMAVPAPAVYLKSYPGQPARTRSVISACPSLGVGGHSARPRPPWRNPSRRPTPTSWSPRTET
jgi:hypothetical protein